MWLRRMLKRSIVSICELGFEIAYVTAFSEVDVDCMEYRQGCFGINEHQCDE
jgi:hypothetical protein